MDDIKIVKSLEKPFSLTDGVSETLKYDIKKEEGEFLGAMMDMYY